ncbi:unnamed protein product [Schistocephalus solidus]|uniref:Uncharacterized protein n=1 Tax=Schistocephalus solidus TaxID=70667 RepID=A0A183TI54_SCHSO|nr:unnamed protein product [Schistocephalus solidus]
MVSGPKLITKVNDIPKPYSVLVKAISHSGRVQTNVCNNINVSSPGGQDIITPSSNRGIKFQWITTHLLAIKPLNHQRATTLCEGEPSLPGADPGKRYCGLGRGGEVDSHDRLDIVLPAISQLSDIAINFADYTGFTDGGDGGDGGATVSSVDPEGREFLWRRWLYDSCFCWLRNRLRVVKVSNQNVSGLCPISICPNNCSLVAK